MHPCRRYLTPDDTHDLYVICLGKEHARDVFEEAICVHCEHFFKKKAPLSFVSLSEKKKKKGSHLLPAVQDPPLLRHGGE